MRAVLFLVEALFGIFGTADTDSGGTWDPWGGTRPQGSGMWDPNG